MARVLRRLHTPHLAVGLLDLPDPQAHHVRDVLRLGPGDEVELFDDAGSTAIATLTDCQPSRVRVRVERTEPPPPLHLQAQITIASAIPKGSRADWMIEKLSEIGVHRFIPLAAARSVVLPEGTQRLSRWTRLATEAARQSRRAGTMRIEPLVPVADVISAIRLQPGAVGWFLSPQAESHPIANLLHQQPPRELTLLIGPEGGWSDEELNAFTAASFAAVRLTDTILRIETAALVAAAMMFCHRLSSERPRSA